jgi:hypothetical protein
LRQRESLSLAQSSPEEIVARALPSVAHS